MYWVLMIVFMLWISMHIFVFIISRVIIVKCFFNAWPFGIVNYMWGLGIGTGTGNTAVSPLQCWRVQVRCVKITTVGTPYPLYVTCNGVGGTLMVLHCCVAPAVLYSQHFRNTKLPKLHKHYLFDVGRSHHAIPMCWGRGLYSHGLCVHGPCL